jgi:hypothetical protein
VPAELFVVVAAHAGLHVVRAEVAEVLREHGVVAAIGGPAAEEVLDIGLVALPVEARGHRVALRHAHVALQRGAVALARELVDERAVARVVRVVAIAARGERERRAAEVVTDLAADHLLRRVRHVRQAVHRIGVVFVAPLVAQRIGFDGESIDRAHATAQRDRIALVTVAIRIRVVDEAAGEHRRRRAQARLEAVGRLVAVIRRRTTHARNRSRCPR